MFLAPPFEGEAYDEPNFDSKYNSFLAAEHEYVEGDVDGEVLEEDDVNTSDFDSFAERPEDQDDHLPASGCEAEALALEQTGTLDLSIQGTRVSLPANLRIRKANPDLYDGTPSPPVVPDDQVEEEAAMILQAALRGRNERCTDTLCLPHSEVAVVEAENVGTGRTPEKDPDQEQRQQAATKIQAVYKGHSSRKMLKSQHQAATKVQAAYRGHRARTEVKKQHEAATKLQSLYRGYRTRSSLLWEKNDTQKEEHKHEETEIPENIEETENSENVEETEVPENIETYPANTQERQAATKIQSVYRGYRTRNHIKARHQAATKVQALYRGHRTRAQFARQQQAVTRIQALVRGHKVRSDLRVAHLSATKIQSVFRGHKTRSDLKKHHTAAIKIQSSFRGHLTRQKLLEEKKNQVQPATKIQAVFRGYRTRKQLASTRAHQDANATKIQAAYRGHITRKHLQEQKEEEKEKEAEKSKVEAEKQEAEKRETEKREAEKREAEDHERKRQQQEQQALQASAATDIQRVYRGHKARKVIKTSNQAATKVQAVYRGYRTRSWHQRQVASATKIQATYRGHAIRTELNKKRHAATKIQACWRGHSTRKMYPREHIEQGTTQVDDSAIVTKEQSQATQNEEIEDISQPLESLTPHTTQASEQTTEVIEDHSEPVYAPSPPLPQSVEIVEESILESPVEPTPVVSSQESPVVTNLPTRKRTLQPIKNTPDTLSVKKLSLSLTRKHDNRKSPSGSVQEFEQLEKSVDKNVVLSPGSATSDFASCKKTPPNKIEEVTPPAPRRRGSAESTVSEKCEEAASHHSSPRRRVSSSESSTSHAHNGIDITAVSNTPSDSQLSTKPSPTRVFFILGNYLICFRFQDQL